LAVVAANLAIAEQIGELLVRCRYGIEPSVPSLGIDSGSTSYQVNPNGCQATLRVNMKRCVQLCRFALKRLITNLLLSGP